MKVHRPLNRADCHPCRRRQAFALIQMLSVLFIVAVGSTLMVTSIASIMRVKKHADALTNRHAVLTDFTRCLRRDVRGADAMSLSSGLNDEGSTLTLEQRDGSVCYTFLPEAVERVGADRDFVSNKAWSFARSLVSVELESPTPDAAALVHVAVCWRSLARDDLQPQRRFDLVFHCAGEVYDEQP